MTQYLDAPPPAIAGEHGDLHTFRVCCRLVRAFTFEDDEAMMLLTSWCTHRDGVTIDAAWSIGRGARHGPLQPGGAQPPDAQPVRPRVLPD